MCPGPRPAQDTPRTGVCCRCRQHVESDAPPEAALRAWCAPGPPGRRGQRPWGRRWDTGPALWRRGGEHEDREDWGEASGTKVGMARGRRRPEQRGGAAESILRPGGALGGAGPGPASWVSGAEGHAAIHTLQPRAETQGLGTGALPGVTGWNPRSTGRASATETSSEPNP